MVDLKDKNKLIKTGLKAAEKLQFIAIILASFILIAGVDLIAANVGWNMITDPYFYIGNLITDVALLFMTFGTVYLVIDVLKDRDKTYLAAKEEIGEFAVSRENIPSVVSLYLETLNRKRKINQYEFNILIKLYKLENRRKWYSYIPFVKSFIKNPYYYTEEDLYFWNHGTPEEKNKSEYCRRRKIYEEQLSKEFIENNIDKIYVKYDKITLGILLSEYYVKANNIQVNDFITKNESGRIAKFRIPTLIFSFGFTFVATSLILDSIRLNWIALITITAKLLTIIWNMFTSYRYAKKHFNAVTLHDILFRRSIISEYKKWLQEQSEAQQDGAK